MQLDSSLQPRIEDWEIRSVDFVVDQQSLQSPTPRHSQFLTELEYIVKGYTMGLIIDARSGTRA